MNQIKFKNNQTKLVDLDEKNHIVKIQVSAFGNKDSDGDIIEKGAYAKTIQERGPGASRPRIKHLEGHVWTALIGRPEEMTETNTHLEVVSKIANSTRGRDAIENYKLDLYEHSVGFEVPDGKQEFSESRDANIIKEIKLWEYSSVPWGANDNTPLVELKGMAENPNGMELLNKRMERLMLALRKGDFTDDGFEMLEYELRVLQGAYNSVISTLEKSLDKGTSEPDDKEAIMADAIKSYIDTNFENGTN